MAPSLIEAAKSKSWLLRERTVLTTLTTVQTTDRKLHRNQGNKNKMRNKKHQWLIKKVPAGNNSLPVAVGQDKISE